MTTRSDVNVIATKHGSTKCHWSATNVRNNTLREGYLMERGREG